MLSGHPTKDLQILHLRPRLQDYCEIEMTAETVQDAETVLFDDDPHCMANFRAQAQTVLKKTVFTMIACTGKPSTASWQQRALFSIMPHTTTMEPWSWVGVEGVKACLQAVCPAAYYTKPRKPPFGSCHEQYLMDGFEKSERHDGQ